MQERTRWLVLAGVLLVAAVVGWRLTAGSYKGDIQKICRAEKSSGVDGKQDIKKVEAWAKDHLETPEASAWLTELAKKGLADRAKGLRDEAARVGAGECPLVSAYDVLVAEGEYRQDLASLCTTIDLPAIEAADDDARRDKIVDYIQKHAKSPRTKGLVEKLAPGDSKSRADVIREAASQASIYQCELVSTLLKPRAAPPKDEPVIQLENPQINGDLSVDKIVATFVAKQAAMRACYDEGLARKADLRGRVMLKLALAPSGKTVKAGAESGTTLPDGAVVRCVVGVAKDLVFPPSGSPMVALLLPLDFIPKAPTPTADPHRH